MHANNADPKQEVDTDDFMNGFNSGDDDHGGSNVVRNDGGNAGQAGGGAGAATGDGVGDGAGAAGGGDGGAATGGQGDQFAAGMADGDGTAAGATGDGARGVDSPENREQVPDQPGAIDLSGLPEPIRQRLEQADRDRERLDALSGQLSATQRDYTAAVNRVAPLQSELAALKRAQQETQTGAGAGGASGGNEGGGTVADSDKEIADAEAYFESDEFKKYAETWPAEAQVQRETQMRTLRAVRSLRAQMDQQVGTLGRTVQNDVLPHLNQVRQNVAVQERNAELDALTQTHPDWREINASDEFGLWFQETKPLLNFRDEAHMRERINDGQYVSALLTRYKRETAAAKQQGQRQDQQQDIAAGNTGGQGGNAQNARLALAGAPEQKGAAVVQRQGASGLTPGDDFLAGFNSND